MSFWNRIGEFIFGKIEKVQHPFFGEMLDAGNYYECRRLFRPSGKIVEIGLEKTEVGKDIKQIEFFHWIENNFDLIIEKITPTLLKRLKEWIPDFQITDFKQEFILEYLYIPTCETDVFEWKISFFANNEIQHWCSFDMKGLEVKHLLIDG